MKQRTIAREVNLSGKGLHLGKISNITIKPTNPNTGYVFVRTDLKDNPIVHAIADNVTDTSRGTTISENGVSISTIEHLLSATYAFGIDNAEILIDGPEVPIFDGSARYYINEYQKVGTIEQDAELKILTLESPLNYKNEKNTEISITPADSFSLSVYVDYGTEMMPAQTAELFDLKDYISEISVSRTFVFLSEIEYLLNLNLIKGGDLDNAIVIVDKILSQSDYDRIASLCGKKSVKVQNVGVLNNLKLQFDNEPARHKLLDLIGDLALCGYRFNGKIVASRPGHFANTQITKILRQYLQKI